MIQRSYLSNNINCLSYHGFEKEACLPVFCLSVCLLVGLSVCLSVWLKPFYIGYSPLNCLWSCSFTVPKCGTIKFEKVNSWNISMKNENCGLEFKNSTYFAMFFWFLYLKLHIRETYFCKHTFNVFSHKMILATKTLVKTSSNMYQRP